MEITLDNPFNLRLLPYWDEKWGEGPFVDLQGDYLYTAR